MFYLRFIKGLELLWKLYYYENSSQILQNLIKYVFQKFYILNF